MELGTCLGAYLEEGTRTGARPNSRVRGWRSKCRRIWGWLQRGAHPPPPQSRHKNVGEAVGAALGAPGHAPSSLTFFRKLNADPEARSHAHHLAVLGLAIGVRQSREYCPLGLSALADFMVANKAEPRVRRALQGIGINPDLDFTPDYLLAEISRNISCEFLCYE